MDILIVGSVAFDTITTPFGHIDNTLGGSGSYFSLAARYFATPNMVAVVGEDFTAENKKVFLDAGIDMEGLEKAPGKTFRWGGKYDFDLNKRETLFTELNVFENFQPKIPSNYQNCAYVFLGNIHPSLQENVLGQIQKPEFVGLDTMNYWIEKAPGELSAVIKKINALIINDSEAREFSDESNIYKAAKNILSQMEETKHPVLVIKRGEYGVVMFQYGEDGKLQIFNLPGYPLEDVIDPTGAGDALAGGFMGYIASTEDITWENLKKACVAGSTLASFSVEKMGVEGLLNHGLDDIRSRSEQFRLLANF